VLWIGRDDITLFFQPVQSLQPKLFRHFGTSTAQACRIETRSKSHVPGHQQTVESPSSIAEPLLCAAVMRLMLRDAVQESMWQNTACTATACCS
jgi:hypothetical protein